MKLMYEYKCNLHGVFEAYVDRENRRTPIPCRICDKDSEYVVSTPRVELEGMSGDFPSAANQWATKHEKGAKQRSHWIE